MAKDRFFLLFFISFVFVLLVSLYCSATDEDRQVYIVYMGALPAGEYSPLSHHLSILQEVVDGSSATDILIRSYKRSFNGFAAKLTHREQQKLASLKRVVSIFPSRTLQLQTTRSWDFMGLPLNVTKDSIVQSDIIVGVIDSGIWPESESFSDKGFGPAPKKWKGVCKGGENFTCNNKLIGARDYAPSAVAADSARDEQGHGTHTASTVVGNIVKDVNFYGLAGGTARGGVPSARLAVYKVCNGVGCGEDAILAAFDDAIADGVDIITISLGRHSSADLYEDAIAIGAFHAMGKGVLTVHSAGNAGPRLGTVLSVAPWLLSVAASSIDRRIVDKIVLGNGKTLIGSSVNAFSLNGTKIPLVHGKDVSSTCDASDAGLCSGGCLESRLVSGKIVLCDAPDDLGTVAYKAGAIGSVLQNMLDNDVSHVVAFPALVLGVRDYDFVMSYMNSTVNPTAIILKSEAIKDVAAPVVASFSSRGPNLLLQQILKPDITAPGVDILAAFSPVAPPSTRGGDKRSVKYNILSGTSMSCPHAAGAAAYVKTFHPDWSPSAIKSALMTTAWPMNPTRNSDGEFAYGSGHINPVKAVDPGLVYEAYKEDYIKMLCDAGYSGDVLKQISGDNSSCPKETTAAKDLKLPLWTAGNDLNLPSLTVAVIVNSYVNITFTRTVTNVGLPNSTYTAKVTPNPKFKVTVVPDILSFKSLNEKKSFEVTVSGAIGRNAISSTSLVWSDGTHFVRSPIVVAYAYFR